MTASSPEKGGPNGQGKTKKTHHQQKPKNSGNLVSDLVMSSKHANSKLFTRLFTRSQLHKVRCWAFNMVMGITEKLEQRKKHTIIKDHGFINTTVNLDKLDCSSKEDRITMKLENEKNTSAQCDRLRFRKAFTTQFRK